MNILVLTFTLILRVQVKEIQTPETYNGDSQNQQSDIAILKLDRLLEFSQFVLPACLDLDQYFERIQLESGNKGIMAGWGFSQVGVDVLKVVDLPVVQYESCRNLLPKSFIKYLTGDKMCVGYINGSGVCSGDSGGGLLFKNDDRGKEKWYLRGIVSLGVSSQEIGQPCPKETYTTFTRLILHSYWILKAIAQLNIINTTSTCTIPQPPKGGSIHLLNPIQGQESNTIVPTGTELGFICEIWYTLEGSDNLKCQSNGQWDKNIPTCKKMCTSVTETTLDQECETEGRKVPCEQYLQHGSTINLKCKPQHIHREILPKLTCIDGSWSHYIPRCVPECGLLPTESGPLMIGRKPARHSGLPWMVGIYSMLIDSKIFIHICGGTIITNTIVISAGHCFWNEDAGKLYEPENFQVATGKIYRDFDNAEDLKYTATVQRIGVVEIQIPETYNGHAQNYRSDIAILRLDRLLKFSQFVLPACMDLDQAFDRNQLEVGSKGKAGGWGLTLEDGSPSEVLKVVDLRIEQCRQCFNSTPAFFAQYITADKICAENLKGANICVGDTGGGLVFKDEKNGKERWYLRGIVSVGVPSEGIGQSCRDRSCTGFTRLFFHRDWIIETLAHQNHLRYVTPK